ncbi:hypothetical protein Bca101_055005 [Brassica carinata]
MTYGGQTSGKADNEWLRVRRRRGGLVYHIHGHSGDMMRIRMMGVDLISILGKTNWIEGYEDGEEACREDKEQSALHCPECICANHFTLTIKASYFFLVAQTALIVALRIHFLH